MNKKINTLEANLKIITQNIRCVNDGIINSIENRSKRLKQLIVDYNPDIIGFQEVSRPWHEEIINTYLEDYYLIGISRCGNQLETYENSDESNLILVKKNRFKIIKEETFWLSLTPNCVSKIENSKYTRICTYTKLFDQVTNQYLLFCNTHLDHEYDDSIRQQQIKILIDYLNKKYLLKEDYPIFITGDFNSTSESETYQIVSKIFNDSKLICTNNLSSVDYTYHEYGKKEVFRLIDYCFTNLKNSVYYYIINDDYNGFVSDHYGIIVGFKF